MCSWCPWRIEDISLEFKLLLGINLRPLEEQPMLLTVELFWLSLIFLFCLFKTKFLCVPALAVLELAIKTRLGGGGLERWFSG